MRISPISLHSYGGKHACGNVGVTGEHDKWGAGLTIAGRVIQKNVDTTAPFFCFTTVKGHKKDGGETTRAPFLVLRIEHVPNRPDLIQYRGLWLMTTTAFKNAYKTDSMRQTDELSGQSIDELQHDAYIIDLGWKDTIGALKGETSIVVTRELGPTDDPDAIALTHMVRRHYYGKRSSYPRLESITRVLGPNWALSDLLDCRFDADPTFCPPSPPPLIGATASGLVPLGASFPTVPADICYVRNHTVRVGGGPGRILHCVEFEIEDDPEGLTGLLHPHARPATSAALLRGTAILELREVVTPTQLAQLKARPSPPPPPPPSPPSPSPPPLPRAPQSFGYQPSLLVYSDREVEVQQAHVVRPVDLFPQQMAYSGRLDRSHNVRTIPLCQRDGKIFEVAEPVTDRGAITALQAYYNNLVPGAREDLEKDLRSEARVQIVPTYGVNLHQARFSIPAMSLGRCMAMSGSHLMQWIGDSSLTLERGLYTREDLGCLWGAGFEPGWRIPDTFIDEQGKSRKRPARCTAL